jgi:hypothetical protein
MPDYIYIYKSRDGGHLIARPYSFGFNDRVLDIRSGTYSLQLTQGMPMEKPTAWDWKVKENGRTYAGLKDAVYDITEVECTYFPRL